MRRTKFSLQALCQVKTGCLVPQRAFCCARVYIEKAAFDAHWQYWGSFRLASDDICNNPESFRLNL